jgi:hypothetical protein
MRQQRSGFSRMINEAMILIASAKAGQELSVHNSAQAESLFIQLIH